MCTEVRVWLFGCGSAALGNPWSTLSGHPRLITRFVGQGDKVRSYNIGVMSPHRFRANADLSRLIRVIRAIRAIRGPLPIQPGKVSGRLTKQVHDHMTAATACAHLAQQELCVHLVLETYTQARSQAVAMVNNSRALVGETRENPRRYWRVALAADRSA